MSEEKEDLKEFTNDWQKRHHVADDDPLFAVVELFERHINFLLKPPPPKDTEIPSFTEFRDSLEKLDEISKRFASVGQDLTRQIQKTIPRKNTTSGSGLFFAIFVALLGAGAVYLYLNFDL